MNGKKVGIGEVKVEQGMVTLSAYGVGSCVVIILYDTKMSIGGLAHCLLPCGNEKSSRYPKGAVKKIIEQMSKMGAHQDNIVAKVVGGANMFEDFAKHAIGKRNVIQARKELDALNISIVAEDVFGNWGRSISFKLGNGEVNVRSYKH